MKKIKNYLIWSLPLILAFAVAGCKNSPTSPQNTATPVNTAQANTATVTRTATALTINTATRTATRTATVVVNTATFTATSTLISTATATATMTTVVSAGQLNVNLRSSAGFAVLAAAAIADIPTSSINGDVGDLSARSTISGLTAPEVNGVIYAFDDAGLIPAMLTTASIDAQSAYLDATDSSRGTPAPVSGNLNGLTLYPGLYESSSSIEISAAGFLYLDGQGDSNAVFIIRSATSITTSGTSEVVLTGGAQAKNIYWTAGSAVTLGTNSIMKGTILAGTSITLQTGANLQGRALLQGAAAAMVSLDSSTITLP